MRELMVFLDSGTMILLFFCDNNAFMLCVSLSINSFNLDPLNCTGYLLSSIILLSQFVCRACGPAILFARGSKEACGQHRLPSPPSSPAARSRGPAFSLVRSTLMVEARLGRRAQGAAQDLEELERATKKTNWWILLSLRVGATGELHKHLF